MNDVKEKNAKEMELLLSEQEVKIDGKVVVVHKLSMLDTIRLASQMSVIATAIVNNSDTAAGAIGKISANTGDINSDRAIMLIGIAELFGLVGEDAADLVQSIMVKSTNLSYEDTDNISADDGFDILVKIYEVNKGFFAKFLKKLQDKMKSLAKEPKKEETPKKTKK